MKSITKSHISLFLFTLVNLLFCYKYGSRVLYSYTWIPMAIYCLCVGFIIYRHHTTKQFNKFTYLIIAGILIIGGICISIFIPETSLNVDRWDMIETFWNSVFSNNYPYQATGSLSGNHPGPMPAYFILCLPYYLTHSYAFIAITGIIIFYFYNKKRTSIKNTETILLLLITSPAILWEICCRSTIFFNSCLFFIWLYSLKYLEPDNKKIIISAIIGGILLSTRNVFVIPILFILLPLLSNIGFKRLCIWGITLCITYISTIIPMLYWGVDNFLSMNPFIIQSSFLLPFNITLTMLILSIIPCIYTRNNFDNSIFGGGLYIFTIILIYSIYIITTYGYEYFITTGCDISYFIFSFPFLLTYIPSLNDKRANNICRNASI